MDMDKCDLCGSAEHSVVYTTPDAAPEGAGSFQIVECNMCGLGFISPKIDLPELFDFYYHGYYDWLETADHEDRMKAEAAYLPPVTAFKHTPRLLDIGSGMGSFALHMIEHGWEVECVEPICPIEIKGLHVHRNYLTELDETAGPFDAATAWAVLEHVPNPKAYFQKVAELLKPGGTFVFLVTNYDSLSSKRLFQEDIPRHCTFFTRKTVESYLHAVGMELVSVDFDDKIFSMGSRGALNYYFCRFILRRDYEREDYPASYPRFLEANGMRRGVLSASCFAITHPISLLDRFFEPVIDRWQKFTRTYGIATYVARK